VQSDTFFPEFDRNEWRESARERHAADERHAFGYSFVVFERIRRKNRQD
jgi:dihydrofolate reductase